ncbi:MAG: hypothetical protein G5Z43_001227 [Caldisphaeraceae archaeon]|nr:hypothetical protein [Caldisphaeraceae archaeon]
MGRRQTKRILCEQMRGKADSRDAIEWLYDDFGITFKAPWNEIIKATINRNRIAPNNVVVLMLERGVGFNERAWGNLWKEGVQGSRTGNKYSEG